MNQEKRARFIERAALREAQKAIKRRDGAPLTREEVLNLRIQSLSVWLRLFLVLAGFAGLFVGIHFFSDEYLIPCIASIVLGLVSLIAGIVGVRRTLKSCLEVLGEGLPELVIQAILSALD